MVGGVGSATPRGHDRRPVATAIVVLAAALAPSSPGSRAPLALAAALNCTAPNSTTILNALSPTCAEGNTIEVLFYCTPRCEEGYVPDETVLNCFPDYTKDPPIASLFPPTFYCDAQPCVQPVGIPNAADPPCGQDVLGGPLPLFPLHRGLCIPQCAEGYRPSLPNLTCIAGKLYPPVFDCLPKPCVIGEYPNNFTVECEEFGGFFYHGEKCTPKCPFGYASTEPFLECTLGELLPNSYDCVGLPCEAMVVPFGHPDGTCVEGSPIQHEENCTTRCADGYEPWCNDQPEPSDGCQLRCEATRFHTGFRCMGKPCQAPDTSGIANAAVQACDEGDLIKHGGVCTPRCAAGYRPNVDALTCSLTVLEPATYSCVGLPCDAPTGIVDGAEVSCLEGPSVPHGGVCTPVCSIGFLPSIHQLTCTATVLSPAAFECIGADCVSPVGVANALAPACAEADAVGNISHGGVCTPRCAAGYEPLTPSLVCRGAVLRPSTLMCVETSSLATASLVTDDVVRISITRHLVLTQLDGGTSLMCSRDLGTPPEDAARCAIVVGAAGGGGLYLGPSTVALPGEVEGISLAAMGGVGKAAACYRDAARDESLLCRVVHRGIGFAVGLGSEVLVVDGAALQFALAPFGSASDAAAAAAVVCYQRGSVALACRGLVAGGADGRDTVLGVAVDIGGVTALSLALTGLNGGGGGLGAVCFVNGFRGRRVGCRALRLSTSGAAPSALSVGEVLGAADPVDALSEGEAADVAVAGLGDLGPAAGAAAAVVCFADAARGGGCRCRALTVAATGGAGGGPAATAAGAAGGPSGDLVAAAGLVRGASLLTVGPGRALLCYQLSDRPGEQRGECRVVLQQRPLADAAAWPALATGAAVIVSTGRTWNLSIGRLSDDTALVCYTDSSERERGKCRIVWGPWQWVTAQARVCDAAGQQYATPSASCFAA